MMQSRTGFWKRYRRNQLVVAASVFLLLTVAVALLTPTVLKRDPFQFSSNIYSPPSLKIHPMGTDHLGRDVFARILWGSKTALLVGLGSALMSAFIGTVLGAVGGYFGGVVDSLVMRATDAMLGIPIFFIVLLIGTFMGANIRTITLILGLTIWPGTARLVRAEVMALQERGFVEASRATGAGHMFLLVWEILPNAVHPAIALISLNAAWSILAETGLSFLGLRDTNQITWGWMLNESLVHYRQAWWMAVFPGLVVSLLVFSFNLIGDGINDALNPRIREGRRGKSMNHKSDENGKHKHPGFEDALLRVQDLSIDFPLGNKVARVVDTISFFVRPGEVVGLVGESGSGKTMTALAIMGLLPSPGYISRGEIQLLGTDMRRGSLEELQRIRAKEAAITFQDPLSSLNPVMKVGEQIAEPLIQNGVLKHDAAIERAVEMMKLLSIPAAGERASDYPHQLSGGMRQRILLAMALVRQPKILIIDEPTTALDVITQREVLDLIRGPVSSSGAGILLITHDVGIIAETSDRMLVMYAGRIMEIGPTEQVLQFPSHPYTKGLLQSLPTPDDYQERLPAIPGSVPTALRIPSGCRFHPRCPDSMQHCVTQIPPFRSVGNQQQSACWLNDAVNKVENRNV